MIGGVHTILYSKRPEAVRAFFRDVLRFRCVDAGGGWLVFEAPPCEIGIHPAQTHVHREELFLMCADIKAEVARLKVKGVEFTSPIIDQQWGLVTQFKLPDGELLGLYQPTHPMAVRMLSARGPAKSSAKNKTRLLGKKGRPKGRRGRPGQQ